MLYDNHVHTEFSADSEMKAEDAITAASREGIGLVFTEHLDIDYPGDMDFTFDPKAYWDKYEPLRNEKLGLGVEIGMREGTEKENQEFASSVPFDMVIGSIHLLEGKDIYYRMFYKDRSQQEVYSKYLRTMAEMLRTHSFVDVLGHIDYICRYAPYDTPGISYAVFHDEIDQVLRTALETDTVLELNTRRLSNRAVLDELYPIYKRYYELGGRYLSIGSDAHKPEAIGAAFLAGLDFAESCGFTPVTFAGRKMVKNLVG